MDFKRELAIPSIGPKQKVSGTDIEIDFLQSGAILRKSYVKGSSIESISTSRIPVLTARIEKTKKYRLMIESNRSITSTNSFCDKESEEILTTIPESHIGEEYSSQSTSSYLNEDISYLQNSKIPIRIIKRRRSNKTIGSL